MGQHVQNNPLSEESFYSSSDYDEIWRLAEEKTAALLSWIQPSKHSEECRKGVINYVKSVLEREIGCKVFSFGSVPLKTYLPDGDIDLTAISRIAHFSLKPDAWAERVCEILGHEERIHVKEVKCIHAEVPVVKCLVENIIVDITFNQLGGLSTLCFLEEVDKMIGKDHLFKKSIILVKAWCFYESRILGAHHGLLSTYALEVLVLYIFHVYHHSLRGPFEVLFRFLRFFSKFEWEKFCLSPWGPYPLDELHNMIEAVPSSSHGNGLLSKEFLDKCREKYRTHSENNNGKPFAQKNMNLVDPLRPLNNLGRSVNRGNLVRIYSAFAYGAARLEKLLQSPKEYTLEKLDTFFCNTHKHCEGQRPDAGFLSIQGDTLCNGKLQTGDLTASGVIVSSGHLNDIDESKCGNDNGVHTNKSACDDWIHGPNQSNSDASLVESILPSSNDHLDNVHICVPDGKDDLLRSDMFVNRKAVVSNIDSNSWSELQLSDSCPSVTSSSVVSKDCKADTDSQKDLSSPASTPKLNSASSYLSETASVGSEEELLQWQAVSSEGDFSDKFECRDTQVAFLDGDYATYFDNLESGWAQQYAYSPRNSGAIAWRFVPNCGGRNVPFHVGAPCLPTGAILGSLPKNQKGTGTFLPTLKLSFERDKRGYPNVVRSPRRNMDSFNAANHNVLSASKSRVNVPKRRDGPNKGRSRRMTDLTAGGNLDVLSTEDSVQGDVQSPKMETTHVDSGVQRITTVDCSLRAPDSTIVPASQSKRDLFIENLEFGSFGPGFLANGLQSCPERRKHIESVSHSQQNLFPDESSVESRDVASKQGNDVDHSQNVYHMKEEDFPPLPLVSPNGIGAERAALHQASYQQACLQNHSNSATKGT